LEHTGVTLQAMTAEVDAGDVLAQEEVVIERDDNAETLCRRLTEAGTALVERALPQIAEGRLKGRPQDAAEATYAPLLSKADTRLDFSERAEELCKRIRAFAPRPGAYCLLDGRRLKITAAEQVGDFQEQAGQPGKIVEVDGRAGFFIQTGNGLLLVARVQPEGKAEMTAAEWLRGARIESGRLLCSDVDK